MKKTYHVVVGTRSRITVPFDCWMDTEKPSDYLEIYMKGNFYRWSGQTCFQPNLSYRITVPFEPGTEIELIPDSKVHCITARKIGPYFN